MSERDRAQDLLGAYVLGHLEGDDLAFVEAVLADDRQLREEAEELRAVVGLLPLASEDAFDLDLPADLTVPEGLAEAVLESLALDAADVADAGAADVDVDVEDTPETAAAPDVAPSSSTTAGVRPTGGGGPQGPAGRRPRGRGMRWVLVAVPAAMVVLVVVVATGVVLRGGVPEPGLGVVEEIEVEVLAGDVEVAASLVPHTWGTELFLDMTGLDDGEIYLVDLEAHDGSRVSAGTFIGDGDLEVVCVMNGAVLREDVAAMVITTEDGTEVMRSELDPVDFRSV